HLVSLFVFEASHRHRDLHSFPTRRSSDLVDERARGRGVGEALTREALRRARERGARTVDLTSRAQREAANRMYERIGFQRRETQDRKSTRLNSSHLGISYAVFCLKKKNKK